MTTDGMPPPDTGSKSLGEIVADERTSRHYI